MSRKLTTIVADNSITGSGKTFAAIRHIIDKQQNTLIVVPSIHLANEYEQEIQKYSNSIGVTTLTTIVTSEHTERNVSTRDLLNSTLDTIKSKKVPAIVVTTHETFKLAILDNFTDFKGFHLLIDEVIQLYSVSRFDISKFTAAKFIDWFDFKSSDNNLLEMHLKADLHSTAQRIVNKEIYDDFINDDKKIEFLQFTKSDAFSTYIIESDFEHANKVATGILENGARLYSISIVNKAMLEQFKSVTILAAKFEMTILSKCLEIAGFKIKYKIFSDRATEKHTNGSRMKIHYLLNRNNSISYKAFKQDTRAKMDNEDVMVTYIMNNIIQNNKFIVNNNLASREKRVYTHYQALPDQDDDDAQSVLVTAVAGVNKYKKINYALYTTSRNIDNAEKQILAKFGIDEDFANADRNLLSAYQFFARTSIRDVTATSDVHICCIDKRTAEFIASLYPDAEIIKHETGLEDDSDVSLPPVRTDAGQQMRRIIKAYSAGKRKFRKDASERFCKLYEEYPVPEYRAIYDLLKA
ncbi:DEAD/DEAH box helicase family protein [Vreelandella titanicae]|uniref:DEAD/DEAH-box helicase domain-containing protein n=1 Tax=Vreelandella titanicae TaxID=664683 RepID=A0AAP9NLR4_9GAMM|nr:DEAD/DEAH box helicase family protein [Halomonas titanicae]QKS24614.1 hypothetical protein FX987_02396 [Halomonas titanicae]